jgi:hypothetical protein
MLKLTSRVVALDQSLTFDSSITAAKITTAIATVKVVWLK